MMGFVLGAAAGYVLGARAGRERYEQLVTAYHRIADHPAVQSAAGVAREKLTGAVTGRLRPEHNGRPTSAAQSGASPVTAIPRA